MLARCHPRPVTLKDLQEDLKVMYQRKKQLAPESGYNTASIIHKWITKITVKIKGRMKTQNALIDTGCDGLNPSPPGYR